MSSSRSPRLSAGSLHPTREQLDELDALLQRMLRLPGGPAEVEGLRAEPEPDRSPQKQPTNIPIGRLPEEPIRLEPELVPLVNHPPTMPASPSLMQGPHLYRQKREKFLQTEGETEQGGEDWIPLRSSWQPSPHTWPPLAESWRQAHESDKKLEPTVRQDSPQALPDSLLEPIRVIPPEPEPSSLPKVQAPIRYFGTNQSQGDKQQQRDIPLPVMGNQANPIGTKDAALKPIPAAPAQENVTNAPPDASIGNLFAVRPLLWLNQGFDLLVGWAGSPGRWLVSPGGRTCLGYLGILCLLGALALAISDLLGWT